MVNRDGNAGNPFTPRTEYGTILIDWKKQNSV